MSAAFVLALLAELCAIAASAQPGGGPDGVGAGDWPAAPSRAPVQAGHGERTTRASISPVFDARLIGQPPFLVLPPGGQGILAFDVQNTGITPWGPGLGIDLVHVDGATLGAANPQLLGGIVPVGQIAQWMVPVEAPRAFGVYRTSWQMTHDGEAFGPVLSCAVIVLPHVDGMGTDYTALLSAWLGDLGDQLFVGIERSFEGWMQRLDDWFGDGLESLSGELDRLWRALQQQVQQMGLGAGGGSE